MNSKSCRKMQGTCTSGFGADLETPWCGVLSRELELGPLASSKGVRGLIYDPILSQSIHNSNITVSIFVSISPI